MLSFLLLASILIICHGFLPSSKFASNSLSFRPCNPPITKFKTTSTQTNLRRLKPLRDILGLGPAEIAVSLVVALVLFGPETLKSLSRDVGKAAAELKEIPKTFKEGMDEGAESAQITKMKAIAAEKRKKRDEKLAAEENSDVEDANVE